MRRRRGHWRIRKMQPWERAAGSLYGSFQRPWQLWWVEGWHMAFMGACSSFETIVQAMLRKEETWPR